MFYLKYRSKTISELDNTPVRENIANILKSKQLPHAFLFIGHKGMGKTSTARIFAKAVNCLNNAYAGKGESIEPCNECKNCLSIDTSSNPDVVELDAASNRGIEETRKLIKEAAFAPMSGRYRVFIIDEAHMITPDAFNALLKTLEEPPATVIFILATTNEEKVPRTIVSRCFRIPFGRATKADIKHMLQRVAKGEGLQIPEDIAELIANYSENSFRDATKLLEELVIQNKLNVGDAQEYLGIRAKDNLLVIMKEKSLKEALTWIEDFSQNGGSVKHLLEDLLEKLRIQLLVKNAVITDEKDIGLSVGEIAMLMKQFQEAYGSLRITPIEAIPLEIAVTEFYNHKK
jgi:DNA polymerase III subunit gamma/tau